MLTFLSFLLFTSIVAVFSWRATQSADYSTRDGYFLAGRSLGWITIAGSLLLTNLSTEQLVGLNGDAADHGMQVMAWEVWSSIAIVLMALVFLPRYLKGGVATVSQFLSRRYSKGVGLLVSALLLAALLLNFLPFVLYSGALFINKVVDVAGFVGGDPWAKAYDNKTLVLTVSALGFVGAIYAIFGGLKAVAVSDTINGIGLLIGGLAVPILGLVFLGDKLGDGGGFGGGVKYLTENKPERLSPIGAENENIPFSTLFTGMLFIVTYYWCTNQAIVQRTFGARSLADGQKGVLFAAAMKLLGPLYLVLPGIIAYHLAQGGIFEMEKGSEGYGLLVGQVIPGWMLGFFVAVIFGAVLSSFNSSLNSAATLFSVDFYKGLFNPEATDQQMVNAGKIFGIAVAVVAIFVAPFIDTADSLFTLMKKLAAFYNIPLIAVVVVGMFSKRTPSLGAILGICFGVCFYGIFGFWQDNTLPILGKIHWLHVAGLNFVLIVSIMMLTRLIAPRTTPYEQVATGEVDIKPWPLALPVGITILVLIAVIYFGLAQFGK